MKKVVLIRYSEIFLKGKNFGYFENKLIDNIKNALCDIECELVRMNKRFFVSNYSDASEKRIIARLQKVFGIHSVSRAILLDGNEEEINNYVSTIDLQGKSFRVSVNRADKRFPINSIEYSKKLGGILLKSNNKCEVDLHNPEINVCIDIRENGHTFVYYESIGCLGGMPVGTSGSGLLLLSGGIDSPVAGYMMAKRGMPIHAIHFHSYPYTSEDAKQKVIDLAKILKEYVGCFKLHVISFTEIQENIHKCCNNEFMITIMRRIMYRIAERVAKSVGCQSIITGENLGQVASQTVESMTVTNAVVEDMPIFRPLIAFDKEEITIISKKMGAFDTSILPYEDCCTVFLPKHPVIKPKIEKCIFEESKLDLGKLINNAILSDEIIDI